MPVQKFLNHTLRTYRTPAVINLLGLAVALAAFMMIFKQVSFEYGYDRFRSASDRIYRVEWMSTGEKTSWLGGPGQYVSVVSFPDVKRLSGLSPHIESSGMMMSWIRSIDMKRADTETPVYSFPITYISPSFPETMQMEIVFGEGLNDDLSAC